MRPAPGQATGESDEIMPGMAHDRQATASRRCQGGRDHARQALGGQQFHRAYARGVALSFDQAIDITLS